MRLSTKINILTAILLLCLAAIVLPGAIAVRAQEAMPSVNFQKLSSEQARRLEERKKELQKPFLALGRRINRNPRDLDAHRQRATYYFEIQQYEKAIADYTQIIIRQPTDVKAYLGRAVCYQSLNQDNRAAADLAQIIRLAPRSDDAYRAYVSRSAIYVGRQAYAKAIADYTSILAFKADEWAYQSRADAYRAIKQYDQAIADYTQLIAMSPGSTYGYYGRAEVYKATGEPAKAAADIQAAEKIIKERGF